MSLMEARKEQLKSELISLVDEATKTPADPDNYNFIKDEAEVPATLEAANLKTKGLNDKVIQDKIDLDKLETDLKNLTTDDEKNE